MMIRPGNLLRQAIHADSASDGVAFECALMPVAAATEIHRSEGKSRFQRDREPGLRKAAVTGTNFEQGDI